MFQFPERKISLIVKNKLQDNDEKEMEQNEGKMKIGEEDVVILPVATTEKPKIIRKNSS